MKKLVCTFMPLAMLLTMFTAMPLTAQAETYDTTIDGITYYVDTEADEAWVWFADESITTANIRSEIDGYAVTNIDDGVFYNCESLATVTIPDSVTWIGFDAFENTAYYNDETNWENGVLYIGNYLIDAQKYHYDENDNEVIDWEVKGDYAIKDGTRLIGNGAFRNCTSLTTVTIPDSVTSIGWSVFQNCTSLTEITIPDSVTSIGIWAFGGCTSLTSVTISNSVTSIEQSVFCDCTSLTAVTIPDSVTRIGEDAFYDCASLTSVTIPDSVTDIGNDVLYNTAYYNDETNWENGVLYIDNYLIDAQKTHYDYETYEEVVDLEAKGDYTIKDGTRLIADSAFEECTSLTTVTIPDSVTSICYQAFCGCTSLTAVTIPDSVTSIDYRAFGYYFGFNGEIQKVENFTIYGCTGSAAETYANENEFTFISLGQSQPSSPQGDVNGDGKLSIVDARSMLVAIASGDASGDIVGIADMNGDGNLTLVDARQLLVKIANGEE